MALCLATTILIKMGKARYAWVTLVPISWVTSVTFTAAVQKIWSANPLVGFLSSAGRLADRLKSGGALPAERVVLERTIFNLRLDAAIAGLFLVLVGAVVLASAIRWASLLSGRSPRNLSETPPVWLAPEALVDGRARGVLGWLSGAALLGLGLARHLAGGGETAPLTPGGCAEAACPSRADTDATARDLGARWAAREERRLSAPRCC